MRKHLYKLPMSIKLFVAKLLLHMLNNLANDIVLYNELKLWIETQGRPTTSNPNYWINQNK